MSTVYQVFLTPKVGLMEYGDEIDITDYVKFDGLPTIRRSIDSTDFAIGVYSYDDLSIRCINLNGYFNDEFDTRSIFKFKRDKALVRVVFQNSDGDTIVFKGLINDEATQADAEADDIVFRVLSLDSAIRTTKVSGGVVVTGAMVSDAIFAVLNVPEITAVLGISQLNINPDFDFEIEDGSVFDNETTRDVLNQLLFASNSVMLIDADDNVIIRDRSEDDTADPLNIYGPYDLRMRTNMIRLTNYNPGKHRRFTAIKVNDTEVSDDAFIEDYGYRQKKMEIPFVTTEALAEAIAQRILDEFKVNKIECNVEVPTYVARGVDLLDRVSLDYSLRIKPQAGKFLPVIGSTVIGDTEAPLPDTFGSLSVNPNIRFKVIEIRENPKDFETILKLRQTGTNFEDGYFDEPGSCIIGFARVGEGTICAGGSSCDTFEVANIGAAQVGCTLIA